MTVTYTEQDGDEHIIHTRTVAIIGYDATAQYVAERLRLRPIRLLICGTAEECDLAQAAGLLTEQAHNAVQQADILFLSVADEDISEIYTTQIARGLRREQLLIFRSAYAIAFGFIEPPPFVDVGLIAPRTLAPYTSDRLGARCFIGVGQDASHKAWERLLAFAKIIEMLSGGALELSFSQEAELSLFTQQALIPAFHRLLHSALEVLMGQGYPIEACLTDVYLAGRFTEHIQHIMRGGLQHVLQYSQKTAQYGILNRQERFQELKFERLMETILAEIRNGVFARGWAKEYAEGGMRLEKLQKQHHANPFWDLEAQTLDLFSEIP